MCGKSARNRTWPPAEVIPCSSGSSNQDRTAFLTTPHSIATDTLGKRQGKDADNLNDDGTLDIADAIAVPIEYSVRVCARDSQQALSPESGIQSGLPFCMKAVWDGRLEDVVPGRALARDSADCSRRGESGHQTAAGGSSASPWGRSRRPHAQKGKLGRQRGPNSNRRMPPRRCARVRVLDLASSVSNFGGTSATIGCGWDFREGHHVDRAQFEV